MVAGLNLRRLMLILLIFWALSTVYFMNTTNLSSETPSAKASLRPQEEGIWKPSAQPSVVPRPSSLPPERGGLAPLVGPSSPYAMVIMAYNRPAYLRRVLDAVMRIVNGLTGVPPTLYVSQDGTDPEVAAVIREYPSFQSWQKPRVAALSSDQSSTAWLAQHYKYALDKIFFEKGHSHCIVLEDDMEPSPDFLQFFEVTAPLLDADPSLWCVSSWNDNGYSVFDLSPSRLLRNSFFPGLGWMLKADLWRELSDGFPLDHWDHWMRLETTAKGRECVIPELSRNYNFGEEGANINAAKFDFLLKDIAVNKDPKVDFGDVTYIIKTNYERYMRDLVGSATQVYSVGDQRVAHLPSSLKDNEGSVSLVLTTKETFTQIAKAFHIWNEPRSQHQHTAVLHLRGNTIILADARFSPYIPDDYRIVPAPGLVPTHAEDAGVSCTKACAKNGKICDGTQFEFINSCSVLSQVFACENGCWSEVGFEIPAYVSDHSHPNGGKCLVTQVLPSCTASHPSTTRLCPCR